MAAVAMLQPGRNEAALLLKGDKLGNKFHQMFDSVDENNRKKEKKKSKKKGKSKGKEKSKTKREKSPEKNDLQAPGIELHGNPSSFVVYSNVRQAVLEHQIKQMSQIFVLSNSSRLSDSESEDEGDEKTKDAILKLPKIIGLGLCGVFEIIKETKTTHPSLCTRALKALLDMLQGQQPEGLKTEPADVIDSLYQLLMELAITPSSMGRGEPESEGLTAVACSCLLSLVVARGDTGKMLAAVSSMLMSPSILATQEMKVPSILISLQKSVQAVLLGKTQHPDWLSQGIREKACIDTIVINDLSQDSDASSGTMASDGCYLYIHNSQGLHKVGSGYGGTIKGHLYASNTKFCLQEQGWLAYIQNHLFYRPRGDTNGILTMVNVETLQPGENYRIEGKGYGPHVMFSDGESLCHVAAARDDSFVVRTFSPICSPMPLVSELPLKLARKCLDVFGMASYDGQVEMHSLSTGFEEDPIGIAAGRDFAFIRTPTGKIFYTGRSATLGIKQGGPKFGKWAELPIIKSPKIVHMSVGHEGQHGLLVAEDGSVFFAGTPKRGEDGDASMSKARRQPKPVKPKKMIKLEGKHVVTTACNNGTSAVITRDGDLYMFGKDTIHCDHATGQVTDMKDMSLVSVALGKAHAVVLTNKGHVYSFGINNKGQCGRDYLAGAARELSMPVTMADEEEDADEEFMCPPGKHKWKHELCMVCTGCGECSGYGNSCISSGRPGRHAGMLCGCGSGDSGCCECGVCRSCAGEVEDDKGAGGEAANGGGLIMEVLARQKDVLPLDLIIGRKNSGRRVIAGRQGARNLDQLNRRLEEKRHKAKIKMRHSNKAKAAASSEPISNNDYDQDHVKMSSLPPARVEFGNSEMTAKQVVCGLQHTVVLLENGDVYTFGSNQYGQLGQGDTTIRGSPARVHLKFAVDLVAAGGSHTVLLTTNGQVYTFGHHAKGQLGRPAPPEEDQGKDKKAPWFAVPGLVPGIGAKHGRRATWVGASGDQTFLRIDESLINAHTLSRSNIVANQSCIGLIPTVKSGVSSIKCLMISKTDGSCRSFCGPEQADLAGLSTCLDPVYDVLWSYNSCQQSIGCYNVLQSESRCLQTIQENYCDILGTELAMPVRPNTLSTRSHGALHMLGCLDTLTTAQHLGMTVFEEEKEKQTTTKVYTKEDYSVVNRFESHGGGWGYSGHSIEAVRFMVDTDLVLGGFGLFGGRGEYFGKIKMFDLGPDGGDNETDGELMAESEEMPYECGAREKYPILFDEPILLSANHWYVAWSRISGPSSDCGSSGHSTVTTEDQVVMKFKSSKKSNNGTDVNAGQIPQILYRLPTHDTGSSKRKSEQTEPAHVLSREFSRAVTPECFDSLLRLLNWSWNNFCAVVGEVQLLKGVSFTAALLDLERLVYISTSSLRLVCIYICELYPDQGVNKKTPAETSRLAECVGETRSLLRKILGESRRHLTVNQKRPPSKACSIFEKMGERILKECHHTFTSCFHALYPTGGLKWTCLCELLDRVDPHQNNVEGWGRLLAAVMEALCHPTVKLTNIMPINCEHGTEQILKKQYGTDDNTNSAALSGDVSQFPLLVGHMIQRTEMEGSGIGHWSFREVLDKLLTIVVLPVRQALSQEKVHLPSLLISNTCSLLAAVISELAASATGTEFCLQTELTGSSRPLRVSPNRFMRTTQNPYWNTGDGNPEAICFSVDRSGILLAGVCVYGGLGQYEYELELLSEQFDSSSDQMDMGRWTTLEMVKGSFSGDDCVNDIAEIKFDRPIAVKEGVIYALRLRNRGPKSYNGEGGMTKVKCPDNSVFTFCACSLSSNGTNHTRGQIPQLLYYSAPQDGENHIQNSKALAEYQARKNAISITSTIFRAATDLLHRAQGITHESFAKVIGSANIFSTLLPMGVAYIGPVAAMDPRGAVQVLGLVQEILPPISEINSQLGNQVALPPPTALLAASEGETNGTFLNGLWEGATTSQHYAVVESDHPYKPATVANYKVTFPEHVKWMVLEFDPQCGTAQVEDTLQLYIPGCRAAHGFSWARLPDSDSQEADHQAWWPVLKKFHGTAHWPSTALVLAGNKVCFSLETASDYVKDDKACFYGFKCAVVGYEWSSKPEEGLVQLEKEITSLGGMCAASLMRKDLQLPPASVDEMEEDLDYIDEGAKQIFQAHPSLLSKGFALSQPPTINRALDGNLPFSWSSNERAFLKDFVACTPGTSGGRLAAWMQPESYLDAKNCDILYNKEELKCSWPAVITIQTKDQYEQLVNVPNLKLEAKAVPVVKDTAGDERRAKRLSRYDSESVLTFGGHPPPKLDTPYQVTIKEKKDAYHAICMMKPYESYSFEELRYAAPAVRRPSENMLVRANNDGTYSANWTPGGVGWYKLHITLDGYEIGEVFKVEVKEPPQGVTPPSQNSPKKPGHQPNKMRKFVAQYSAGLRIRVNPSLQSEQVGIIQPNGVICFIDELHNDDGVWLRLSPDSIREWCNPINGYMEAWALQYNQHLGKVLLVPVDEPKSLLDEMIKETIMRRLPELVRDSTQPLQRGPGLYHVVKCGSSGHNIRCRPHMKATPIGMVVLGDTVTVMEDMVNNEGVWVKLDDESKKRYCHEVEGEAWSLARGIDDIFYIQHEANLSAEAEDTVKAFNAVSNVPAKGFDFTTAQQTPSFSAFGSPGSVPTFGAGFTGDPSLPSTSGVSVTPDKNLTGQPIEGGSSGNSGPLWPTFGSHSPSGALEADQGKSPAAGKMDGGSYPPNALSPHPTSPLVGGAVGGAAPRPPDRKDSLVKDITAGIPPELQGVSVKDLVKALGESRVNGNGVTPPRTPPGTPKKHSSRGSSPKPAGSPHPEQSPRGGTSPLVPSSPQPRHREPSGLAMPLPGSPSHSPSRTPPCTPPCTPPTHRRQGSGSLGTPPPTPPSTRRDLSPALSSPRLSSPARSSPCRSSSSSPHRSGSPMTLARPSSASPSRGSHPPESMKGHFSIGASSPKEDVRMSPKACRKDRSRTLRSKRERAASPAPKEKGHSRSRSGSSQGEPAREPVKEALSPSVAQCMRAVFAAFMWHEGIVHDAMACASFLKFHPNLPKEMHKIKAEKDCGADSSKSTPTGTLKKHAKKGPSVDSANININEAVKKMEITRSKERHYSESRASEIEDNDVRDSTPPRAGDTPVGAVTSESQLPPTLKHLVFFWEELASSTLKVILQNLILPSPATQAKSKKYDKKDKEKDKEKKSKKKKDGKYGSGRRGNLFGEAGEGEWDLPMFGGVGGREAAIRDPGPAAAPVAAAAPAAGDRETMCELCGGKFPHPVTYHMRKAHPGCGKHAGGQGYNSGGNFCGGWAGNCGDGGVGGSTWYLMCDICRDRYLKEKRQVMKDKMKKTKKKSSQVKQSSISQVLEAHLVMKNNAMFLLDLASSMGMSLPSGASPKPGPALRLQTALPSVSEDSSPDQCPFSPVPFLYLIQRGAQAADTAFAEEMVFSHVGEGPVAQGLSKSGHFERSVSHIETRMSRSGSVGTDRQKELNTTAPDKTPPSDKGLSATASQCEPEKMSSPGKSVLFQRSISENAGQTAAQEPPADANAENVNRSPMGRRRNNSGGLADGGVSLLKHPSHSMTRLIQSADKASSKQGGSDKVLQRDVMSFVIQRHDLDSLQLAMKQAVRKAACRVFALQAFNWLVRSVTQPSCLHDLLWYFVGSLTPPPPDLEEEEVDVDGKKDKKDQDQVKLRKLQQSSEKDVVMCEHPLSDITIAGEAVRPLLETFHTFLQTISDVMMYLPPGSALQQMAVRCWCLKFKPSDHLFLHKSHVFSNISKILSKSDEGWGIKGNEGESNQEMAQVECLKDLTGMAEIKASSRQAMIVSLTDNSTETFWESGDDDRNRTKTVTITCLANHSPRMVYVHVDNSRDLANKVSSIVFNAGHTAEDLKKLKQVELEPRHSGWVSSSVPEPHMCVVKLEVKGPDNSLRLRQVKALGEIDGSNLVISKPLRPLLVQQKNCETETLKVFRLLTSQVFGKLISDEASNMDSNRENNAMPSPADALPEGDVDLKEHMVSILFSRSKLTHLQKQVCAHIVQAIRKETIRVQEEWEDILQSGQSQSHQEKARGSDAYCFELLSMVLALSGSAVGRVYLAEQHNLLQDLLSLLHTSSPRVQRQVTALLRRVLPEVQPQALAGLLGVPALPPADFSILSNAKNPVAGGSYDPSRLGILDVFLACIAKALTVQVKVKGQGVKGTTLSFRLADCIPSTSALGKRWWMRGTTSTKLAETIIALLKDLASGQLSEAWASVTKGAIAEAILALTKVEETTRVSTECVKTPTLWLVLSSLCVLDQDHVERLSSGQWVSGGEQSQPRPTCSNHDDGETQAIILCNECGNLCADCDRFLHLHRRTRTHQRQVFKEEEEAIKVDLHEGCGRTKLFWVMALADSKTLKAMVEFREGSKGKLSNGSGPSTGTCRFCGTSSSTGILAVGNVCSHPDCQEHAKNCCTRTLGCGHACGGSQGEETCLPCLHGCTGEGEEKLKQDADDMCMVCFTEAISAAPAIQLGCGHVFHQHCCRSVLTKKWVGPRITFGFSQCPICKAPIEHQTLRELLEPLRSLYEDVHRKALMRLEYEGLHKTEAIANPGTRFYHDPASYAMDRYAYYVCFKCGKAYYGGEVRCEEQAAVADEYDPSELVCGACSDVSRAQMCPKHGTDFLEYKCRYCCSVAVFFCFGTTHFCNACHDDFQRVTNIPKTELPHCPCGPKAKQLSGEECPLHVQHPPTGEEFALGCGVCRNAHTF